VVSHTLGQVLGRFVRRGIAMAVLALFALGAIYHFSVAAVIALEQHFGALTARLIIAVVYLLIALAVVGYLYATRAKLPAQHRPGISRAPQDVQIALLIESVLQGYALARSGRAKS
jgi:hypothetical protein